MSPHMPTHVYTHVYTHVCTQAAVESPAHRDAQLSNREPHMQHTRRTILTAAAAEAEDVRHFFWRKFNVCE